MKTFVSILVLLCFNPLFAQDGVSSGSISMMKSHGMNVRNEAGNFNQRMVIVEDFMNYHKHHIKIPKADEPEISIDYSNNLMQGPESFLLQIGVATPLKRNIEKEEANLNVCLVLDNSGSMSGQKINHLKLAIKTFVAKLPDRANLSVVLFNSSAHAIMGKTPIGGNRKNIAQRVENIFASGGTNIHAGLKMGFEELLKTHKKGMNSRVILLTDGMTNTGVTDPEQFLPEFKSYTEKGISISTVGLGASLDFDLLRNLAEAGNGSNYFIGNPEGDIQKVFIDEINSLLFPVGKVPKVRLELPKGWTVEKCFGYQPEFINQNTIEIPLENLTCNSTQIVMLNIKRNNFKNKKIKASLSFERNGKKSRVEARQFYRNRTSQTNPELPKNYSIAQMANALKDFAEAYKNGTPLDFKPLKNSLATTDWLIREKDKDVERVYSILEKMLPKQPANLARP